MSSAADLGAVKSIVKKAKQRQRGKLKAFLSDLYAGVDSTLTILAELESELLKVKKVVKRAADDPEGVLDEEYFVEGKDAAPKNDEVAFVDEVQRDLKQNLN